MLTEAERQFFDMQGYLHVPAVLDAGHVTHLQAEFDRVWELEGKPVNQIKLLKHQTFIDLIGHAPILNRHKAVFGEQIQLLQFDLLRQGPRSEMPERGWHRDFHFPGDTALSVNTILYLDDITEESGPTYVVPGSQRGSELPPRDGLAKPLPEEIAVHAKAGDAVFINSAIWHSGGRNQGEGLRRAIYLYYGYWFLKRYEFNQPLPWQALAGADEERLRLLGVKMPGRDLHMYL